MTNAYLLTWQKGKWEWDNYDDLVKKITNGIDAIISWTCRNKKPELGDEIYLFQYGKGIIGHGEVWKTSYKKPHYIKEKAEKGELCNYIDVKFDWLSPTDSGVYLPSELLNVILPLQTWNPMSSGIKIEEDTELLRKLLDNIKNLSNIQVDFEKIVNFLMTKSGNKYIMPEKTADEAERNLMEQLKKDGGDAYNAFKEFSNLLVGLLPGYTIGNPSMWKNQAQSVPPYFWCEFKKIEYKELPHSISISINKYPEHKIDGELVLSLRVELRDSAAKEDFAAHNKLVEIENSDGTYFQADLTDNLSTIAGKSIKEINCLLSENSFDVKKYKAVEDIEGPYTANNTVKIVIDSIKVFSHLLPFYNHILKERKNELNRDQNSFGKANERKDICEIDMIEKVGLNTILYGPPGTGKTYSTALYAVSICEQLAVSDVSQWEYEDVLSKYKELKDSGRIAFTTFHQSYGYEEFIEGIRPVLNDDKSEESHSQLTYQITPGIFKNFCELADSIGIENDIFKQNDRSYVFIIDEINRGNISKIFGELITLLEPSKRKGRKEELAVKLPYTNSEFSVPSNVYILGTMNTADRSITLMDTALRRRFDFIEMMPDDSLLQDIVVEKDDKSVNVGKILRSLNQRIEFLYDREHMIGHSFFMSMLDEDCRRVENLGKIFKRSIIPLLQEYFYEDYEKIRLVLGDTGKDREYQFITKNEVRDRDIFFGNIQLDTIDKFIINDAAFSKIESYLGITDRTTSE